MKDFRKLKIKLYADGADINDMKRAYKNGMVSGFTTNPYFLRLAGVVDYEQFAKDVVAEIPDLPISFEVISDDMESMELEALKISSWGKHVYAKIPIVNTKNESTAPLIKKLSYQGVKLNVTAVFTLEQVEADRKSVV